MRSSYGSWQGGFHVNMLLVRMYGGDKLVLAVHEFFRERVANFQCLLRCDFSGLEALPQVIREDVSVLSVAPGVVLVNLLRQSELVSGRVIVAAITFNVFVVVSFVGVVGVTDAVRYRRNDRSSF